MKVKDIHLTNWIFSVWPLFLFVSQKALLPLQFLSFLILKKEKLLVYFLVFFSAFACFLMLFWINNSMKNDFGFSHFLGFVLFVVSVVLIGHSCRISFDLDLKWITIFNFVSIVLAIVFFVLNLDFSFFRGLNFIRGSDGAIHRVFIETTPLLILNDYSLFKNKLLNIFLFLLTFVYVFVLCKSFFIIIFFVWRLWVDHSDLIKRKFWYFFPLMLVGVVFMGVELVSYVVRADLALSIVFKYNQLLGILELISGDFLFFGRGFGFVIEEYVTDFSQPYQIEMQLPMLFLQFGLIGFLLFATFIFSIFFISGIHKPLQSTLMYFSVGFVNPWLFLPIWFLTCCYFFRK
ncbi:hypothetical protein J0A67_03435 [Algoriphagus aestuariicola]|uniref:Wzy n=1 Tax=Algoriphagus aestuariicola TaxID=1852016 RepID=A0ABS3BLH1_9BACT|nr:hypothetical protein [Algoriphagus aestuariicola]MBN7799895.1 hypothetical protein [Algoriphagus aestuariicola]